MQRISLSLIFLLVLAACAPAPRDVAPIEPLPITRPADVAGAAVVRRPLAEPPPQIASIAPGGTPTTPPVAAVIVPPNALYVCVSEAAGQRQQTTIEFSSTKTAELCRKHPEMGPCQYERDICRRSGGRVFAANNVEITKDTEAEYDKKVYRVRFKVN